MIRAPRSRLPWGTAAAWPVAVMLAVWLLVTAAWIAAPFAQGLRGQYFEGLESSGPAVHTARDADVSTAGVAMRWWFVAPPAFNVRWTGYLIVERAGLYTFQIASDDGSQLRIGQNLVVDNLGARGLSTAAGRIQLARGAHRVLLESVQAGGAYRFEWSWARDGASLTPVPGWALSQDRRDPWLVDLLRTLPWLWLAATAAGAIALVRAASRSDWWRRLHGGERARIAVGTLALTALAGFYLAGASEHARRVNTSKARADQSGYLRDAQEVYANWHGQEPAGLVGTRNRMPLYAGYLALFWDPRLSNDEFFEQAKAWNIRLSLVLLAVLALTFYRHLPSLIATNLLLIVAFGWFIFKAGYTQSELLFYTLFFLAFLACCHLLRRDRGGPSLLLATVAGVLAGLAHLTKAAALPLVVIFLFVYFGRELLQLVRPGDRGAVPALPRGRSASAGQLAAGALMLAAFVATLYPYISTNKRVFGQYFYNVNTTFYVWYDDWAGASVGTRLHGDDVGWPDLPASDIPSMQTYLKTHSVAAIVSRIAGGARDMVVRSYETFWYAKFVVLYVAFAGALVAARPRSLMKMIAGQPSLFMFLLLYAAVYLPATAFYAPISGTGTARFLLSHILPLMFTLSYFFARPPFRDIRWNVAGVVITTVHFHLLILTTIALDLTFTLWPRLMSTYGGF